MEVLSEFLEEELLRDIDTWDTVSFGQTIDETIIALNPTGIATQANFIGPNGNNHRYQYYLQPKNNHYIFAIVPLFSNNLVPTNILIEFVLCGTVHSNCWVSNRPNNYYLVEIPQTNLVPTLQVIKYEPIKEIYNVTVNEKQLLRIFTKDPQDILDSLKNYNKYHQTNYSIKDYNIKVVME